MEPGDLMDLSRDTLVLALKIVTPALLVGMIVGLVFSLFQTITSLQEQTLSMVPKMLAVVATILLLMPWILGSLEDFTRELFENLAFYAQAS